MNSQAAELSFEQQPASQEPTYEILDATYVKIEAPTLKPDLQFSILSAAAKIYEKISEKYHSLLSWKTLHRVRPLIVQKYHRTAHFGRWINDPNDNTCYNTRAVVLQRDSRKPVTFSETDKCSVKTGHWYDDYTGQIFTKKEDIQIDHFVPLKNAYISGAHRWSFRARCLYANYLGNKFHLKSVNATENMRKGDRSPLTYMPPNTAYACRYLKNWLSVKYLWGLQMQDDEAVAISRLLLEHNCKLEDFKISVNEIRKQQKFVQENMDLCERLAAAKQN